MPRILHIIYSLESGGAQRLVADMCAEMAKRSDWTVEILTVISQPESALQKAVESNPDIRFHTLGLQSDKDPIIIPRLRRYLKNADVAHVHLFPAIYQAAIANIGINTPMVYTEHSTHNRRRDHRWMREAERWVYSRYKAIGCISEAVRHNLEKWLAPLSQTRKHKFKVICNGVNLLRFKNLKRRKPEDVFGREGKALLMISRFTDAKDQPTVIKALKYLPQDMYVVFAGDGATMESCKRIAEDEGVTERVIFAGNRSDIETLISAALIGIQSSHWEGFGLTAVEMMAAGLPVVASDVEGLKDVVVGAGELFRHADSKDLALKIMKICDDENVYNSVSAKERKRAENYDIKNTCGEYITLYRTLGSF